MIDPRPAIRGALRPAGLLVVMAMAIAFGAADARSIDQLSPEQAETVARINHYLNNITHLEGDFTQISPDGDVAEGKFYLRRPGRARFDYAPPNRLVVVADGFWIGVTDRKLETTDRYPIGSTPYWALLKENVDLLTDSRIVAVEQEAGIILVTFDDPSGEAAGQLTLIFEERETEDPAALGLVLTQWLVTDAQGLTTSVSVSNLVEGQRARNAMFVIDD
jgi:outer membrane lipoprotein-sorting protein